MTLQCDDKALVLKDPSLALTVTVEAKRSARASDRIKAASELGKYGLGERMEQVHTMISPDIRARIERMASLILSRDVWPRTELVEALRPIWSDEQDGGAL